MFLWNIAVTSLAEVWIEIQFAVKDSAVVMCHFPCGSVDGNPAEFWYVKMKYGHFPCGSVDWNRDYDDFYDRCKGSLPLRKCGLKSLHHWLHFSQAAVTSLAEVWIEMPSPYITSSPRSHFPCGSVDWNLYRREKVDKWGKSLPLRKCGLKSCI